MTPPAIDLSSSVSNPARRGFLKTSVGASLLFSLPTIVPSRALGRDGHVAPSERVTLGGIGIRRRGTVVLKEMLAQKDVQFVAIADARADSRKAVKELADQQNGDTACQTYRDFRDLLDREDIDAVVIATGDRWHAPMSIYAAEAGKDIYSEKPCAITIGLGGNRRLWQIGCFDRFIAKRTTTGS